MNKGEREIEKINFDKFIESIPKNIHTNTKTYIGNNVAVFIPEEFVVDKETKIDEYHFVLFQSTPPIIEISNIEYQFDKGSFIAIEPNNSITVKAIHSVGTVKYISISIEENFFNNIALNILKNNKVKFSYKKNAYSHQLLDLIEMFIKEIVKYGVSCPLMLQSIETQIAVQLLRDSMPDYLILSENCFSNNYTNDYIDHSIKYMKEYYSSNITIKDICDIIFISPCHFQRIFKKSMNQTPYNYLMKIRIDKAKEKLLKCNNESIEEIGRLCGFLNASHFSSVFKQIEGISPSDYRKNNTL